MVSAGRAFAAHIYASTETLPKRLSNKDDVEEREKQYQRAIKACQENIGSTREDRSPRRSLAQPWKWFISGGRRTSEDADTVPPLPKLSPSATTPGMQKLVPATPQHSLDHVSLSSIHVRSENGHRGSFDSQTSANKRIKAGGEAFRLVSESQLDQDSVADQNGTPEMSLEQKPADIIDFLKRTLSITRISVASALTIQGSRASRWSRRISHKGQEKAIWDGCESCSGPIEHNPESKNIAEYLVINGPHEDEATLLAEVKKSVHDGSDVNIHAPSGETALHIATGAGFEAVCGFLLDHGADVYAVTNDGETVGKYGKRYYRETGRDIERYARINWCLVEVKKHKSCITDHRRRANNPWPLIFNIISHLFVPNPASI